MLHELDSVNSSKFYILITTKYCALKMFAYGSARYSAIP